MSAFASYGHTAANAYGRFVPTAGVSRCSKPSSLFDNLVGARKQRHGQVEAQRLGSLEIDDNFEFGGLLDWKITRIFALETG
jgi:hypothetical protein